MSWYDRDYFPRSRPRAAKGGIKAQTKRGAFGQTWWAKRWIAVLESFNIGARLDRGRSYARKGQVLSVDVDKGNVKSRVQGSEVKPYDIAIQVKVLSDDEWNAVVGKLAEQALFTAKLLAGEMPQEIETVFKDAGVSLFPTKLRDLTTSCSCPDMSNPCKHIAAAYYLLGEEFDRDPFLLFQLRGLTRDELCARLQATSPSAPTAAGSDEPAPDTVTPLPGEPLPTNPKAFWAIGALPEELFRDVVKAPVSAALPKRLGHFPFWRGQEHFLDTLESLYRAAGQHGMEVFQGKASDNDPAT
jgi:uncharacterized Zn finger protein